MALSDKRIIEEKKKGNIIIVPFNKKHLNTSSYDLRLGEWYYREQPSKHFHPIYNIYQESHTKQVWGKPQKAETAKMALQKYNFRWDRGIKETDGVILLQPGETILGHTQEFIGGTSHITTQMQARSSIGRNFLEVCKCAGWGDVGYVNRWTMEITNNSRHHAIPLVVGRRIAQMIFIETGEILEGNYTKDGKYSTSQDVKILQKKWRPEDMLPKLWKDYEAMESIK